MNAQQLIRCSVNSRDNSYAHRRTGLNLPYVAKCHSNLANTLRGISRAFLFLTVITLSYSAPRCVAEPPIMKTLSAHVVKVAPDGRSLQVNFKHPATEKLYHMTFYVDHPPGLNGIDQLQELRTGQVVNIDYVELNGRRYIRYLARVKLSGPPAGLEKFRGL